MYKMTPILMTFLDMWKLHLITEETAKQFSEGKIKATNGDIIEHVHDDLEAFFYKDGIRLTISFL